MCVDFTQHVDFRKERKGGRGYVVVLACSQGLTQQNNDINIYPGYYAASKILPGINLWSAADASSGSDKVYCCTCKNAMTAK